ncbi:unnamed protein product [Mytilus edulis]|uniref:Uncharacterized protein n=1 Tax=Mytilus edulis TaxID=6550 RepID=A0A8S3QBZ3_MYTED|nr:unnamed protein product [Mytilus edulis]
MADRRAPRFRQRSNQWDSSDPANWTANKLKVELESINIFVPVSLGKNMLKKIYMDNIARRNIAPADQQMTGNTSQTSASSDNAPNTTTSDESAKKKNTQLQAPLVQRELTLDSGSNSTRSSALTEPRINYQSEMAGTTSSNMTALNANNVNNAVKTGTLN